MGQLISIKESRIKLGKCYWAKVGRYVIEVKVLEIVDGSKFRLRNLYTNRVLPKLRSALEIFRLG